MGPAGIIVAIALCALLTFALAKTANWSRLCSLRRRALFEQRRRRF